MPSLNLNMLNFFYLRYTQRDWLRKKLLMDGLEVFDQDFSCEDQKIQGQNIYGILRYVYIPLL